MTVGIAHQTEQNLPVLCDAATAAATARVPEVAAIDSLKADFGRLLNSCVETGANINQRATPDCPTLVEHALHLRDLLNLVAARIESLAADAVPAQVRLRRCESTAGYHRWSPEDVLRGLGAETERLARITGELATNDGVDEGTRDALQVIAAQLLRHALREGEEDMRQVALTAHTGAIHLNM